MRCCATWNPPRRNSTRFFSDELGFAPKQLVGGKSNHIVIQWVWFMRRVMACGTRPSMAGRCAGGRDSDFGPAALPGNQQLAAFSWADRDLARLAAAQYS